MMTSMWIASMLIALKLRYDLKDFGLISLPDHVMGFQGKSVKYFGVFIFLVNEFVAVPYTVSTGTTYIISEQYLPVLKMDSINYGVEYMYTGSLIHLNVFCISEGFCSGEVQRGKDMGAYCHRSTRERHGFQGIELCHQL